MPTSVIEPPMFRQDRLNEHWHFIPRHYFLALFVPVLAIMKATESWNPA